MDINSKEDGITHINVYSKGKTSLGRFLSNFTQFPLALKDGNFESIEGYWYWLLCTEGVEREELRWLFGTEAKKIGRELQSRNCPIKKDEIFENKIIEAIKYKILHGPFLEEFKVSVLPFVHYYTFYGKVKLTTGSEFILNFLESFRRQLKDN